MGILPAKQKRFSRQLFDQSLFAERFRASSNALKNGAGRAFDSFPHTHSTMSAATQLNALVEHDVQQWVQEQVQQVLVL